MKNNITRFILVLFVLFISLSSAYAVPAKRGWQTATLQDGTGIEVQHRGDEFYHYWETRDGKIAVMQEDGTFVISDEVAPTGEQAAARRSMSPRLANQRRAKMDYGALQPTKLLVLLVNFSDKSMTSSHNNAFFQNLLNGSFPSVQDYFNQSSGGNYVPTFDVFGPYTLPNNMAYYGGNDSDGNDEHPDQMVVDACALAYADGCNFSNYDTNGDKKVDNIYVIYAGYGEAAGAPANTVWPHSWEIYSSNVSGTLTYNGKTLGHYACSAELSGTKGSNSDGVGTFAHEFSHVIGLPDYYDTDYGTNFNNGVTPGQWTLMDQGSYNGSGMYPPLYSAYDKYFMKWHTPALLAKDAKANVTLTTTWDDNYQITGSTSSAACTSTSTVYYIENRQKSGYDQYLPGHGMIVWKVTYNGTIWNNNKVNNTAGTLRYTIVPADGKTKDYGDAKDPFPGTGNKTSYTPFTGCALTSIAESSGNITFKYNGGVNKTKCTYEFITDHCTAPADGEVNINAALSVTITPNSGYTLADASCWTVEMGGVELSYGSGFTYNPNTNNFSIASLTDDVVIMAEAKQIHTVTWSVNGSTTTANFADGAALVLPSAPDNCPGGKQFVGWTASTSVTGDRPSDLFNSAGSKTVTADVTYYAVYATAAGGGDGSAFDGTNGGTFKIYAQVSGTNYYAKGYTGKLESTTNAAEATEYTFEAVSGGFAIKVGSDYLKYGGSGTDLSSQTSAYTWSVDAGSQGTWRINSGTSGRAIIYRAGTTNKFGCYSTNNVNGTEYFDLEIGGGSSATYSDYGTTCVVCALSSISLNTDNVTKSFTTDDTFNSTGLVVTANYTNCSSRTVTPSSISAPAMTAGNNKTVTVTYTENDVTKTATYQINVTELVKHTVTWIACGSEFKQEQYVAGAALVLPASNPSANTEGKAFAGWTTEEHYTGASAPTLITAGGAVTADATYYAIYH